MNFEILKMRCRMNKFEILISSLTIVRTIDRHDTDIVINTSPRKKYNMDVIVLLRVVFLIAFLIPLLRCLHYHTIGCGSEIIESITERTKQLLLRNNQIITDGNDMENQNEIGRDKISRRASTRPGGGRGRKKG